VRSRIEAELDGDYGDRRQEIVFSAQQLDPASIRTQLDRCRLDDAEWSAGPNVWWGYPDPFLPWTRDAEDTQAE